MNKYLIAIVFCLMVFSYSCNQLTNWFCGSLTDKQQIMIESGETICQDGCRIEYIPCEYNYVKLYLKSNEMDSILIDRVHQRLYDKRTNEGWPSVMVYNSEGSYVASHGHKGDFYKQSGD